MTYDWWVVLILSLTGGFIGGTVAYYLEAGRHRRARLWARQQGEKKDD